MHVRDPISQVGVVLNYGLFLGTLYNKDYTTLEPKKRP